MFQALIQKVLDNRKTYQKHIENTKKHLDYLLNDQNILYGKFIRSIIFYMFSENEISCKHHKLTAIIELIHTASLIHDDIVDSNDTRRGTISTLKLYGSKISVLKGDFLLISAFKKFVNIYKTDDFAIKYFLRECYSTAYGAMIEQILNKSENPTVTEYVKVSTLKTAPLFKLSALLGAYTSGQPFSKCKKAAMFGLEFGTLFQIQNDLDSYKPELFQNSEDYTQKNITLPVILMNINQTLDINRFKRDSNQQDYNLIQEFIKSKDFKKYIGNLFEKRQNHINSYFNCL